MRSDHRAVSTVFIYLVLILAAPPAMAQSAFLDKAQFGGGVSLAAAFGDGGFERAQSRTVYAVNAAVDLGVSLGVSTCPENDPAGTALEGAVAWAVTLLKQDRLVPISVQLSGGFFRSVVSSGRLRSDGLRMTGGGYEIAMEAFRFVRVTPRLYRRVGLMTSYESRTYVTEREDGSTDEAYPHGSSEQSLRYGGILGLSLRPNRPNRGIAVSFDLRPYVTSEASFGVTPVLTMTVVNAKREG